MDELRYRAIDEIALLLSKEFYVNVPSRGLTPRYSPDPLRSPSVRFLSWVLIIAILAALIVLPRLF